MDDFYKNLSALLIRSFIPASPFYTNFLVEVKKFTNSDVSNRIAPFYFFSSFFAVFFCKKILHQFGIEKSSILVSGISFINLISLLNLGVGNLKTAKMIYFSSGFITTFDMVLRFYLSETNINETKTDTRYASLSSLRAISTSISSCVGQEIVNRTGFYQIPIHISIFSQFLGFLISIASSLPPLKKTEFVEIKTVEAMLSMDRTMLCAFLAGIFSNCFNIFIKFFAQSIFRDKDFGKKPTKELNTDLKQDSVLSNTNDKVHDSNTLDNSDKTADSDVSNTKSNEQFKTLKNLNIQEDSNSGALHSGAQNSNDTEIKISESKITHPRKLSNAYRLFKTNYLMTKAIAVLRFPIILISLLCIKAVVFIFPKYSKDGTVQKKYLNGDIDALTNMMCYYGSYLIVSKTATYYKETLYISFLLFSSICLFFMASSRNKFMLYFMYVLTGMFSKACNHITKGFLKKSHNDNNLIVGGFIIETIVHMAVNQSCRLCHATSLTKTLVYSTLGLSVTMAILFIKTLP